MKNVPAYIGITGALGMAVCDIILLGQPVSGSQYDLSSFGAMDHISSFRAAIGSAGGLFFAFFICFGYWHLKKVFEGVNERLSMLLFISLASVMFFGGAFHSGYYFMSVRGIHPNTFDFIALNKMYTFQGYLEVLSWLGVPGFIAGTILFFKLALNNGFPAWFKYCNPLILSLIFLGLFYFLPAPVGGYIRPTFINLATASMFIISLRVNSL